MIAVWYSAVMPLPCGPSSRATTTTMTKLRTLTAKELMKTRFTLSRKPLCRGS